MMTRKSPAKFSVEKRGSPSTTATSALVPPMSKVITRSWPACRATNDAPMTPAAGPESNVSTGRRPASDAVMTPPLDFVESTGAPMPSPRRPRSRSSKYTDIRCPTYAFITATKARSYSRICGHSSADTET